MFDNVELKHEKPPPPVPDKSEDADVAVDDVDKDKPRRIRCPVCGWVPKKSDRWGCHCGCAWNTFDTAALCPQCGKQWEHTMCLRCHQWSPHKDWYVDPVNWD